MESSKKNKRDKGDSNFFSFSFSIPEQLNKWQYGVVIWGKMAKSKSKSKVCCRICCSGDAHHKSNVKCAVHYANLELREAVRDVNVQITTYKLYLKSWD